MYYRLSRKYGNDEDFALKVRMLKALAFVPSSEISNYYCSVSSTFEDEDLLKLCEWFERNYVKGSYQPKYPRSFWSVYDDSMTNSYPRTQNSVEAWHRRLKAVVGRRKSGLYHLIRQLGNEVVVAVNTISKRANGERRYISLKKRKAYTNIKRVIRKRCELSHTDYLKRIAQNLVLI